MNGGYVANTTTIGGVGCVEALPGGYMEVSDVYGRSSAARPTRSLVNGLNGVGNYRVRNCRLSGASTSGVQSNGGQANRIRILSGCDFTAASYPIIVDSSATTTMTQGEGEYNDATATGTVALTQCRR